MFYKAQEIPGLIGSVDWGSMHFSTQTQVVKMRSHETSPTHLLRWAWCKEILLVHTLIGVDGRVHQTIGT